MELLTVVVILGILSAAAIPLFVNHTEQVEKAAFIQSVKALASTIEQYRALNLAYPADVNRATRPTGMERYFSIEDWTKETPIGGVWDWEGNNFTILGGISVVGSEKSTTYMQELDAMFDNGNLGSGNFRMMAADRYTYVLADKPK